MQLENAPGQQLLFLQVPEKPQRPGPEQAAEKGQMLNEKPEKRPSGAKAHVYFAVFSARLKSCPVTKQAFFRSL
jgi:hypothetical protein